MAVEIKSGQSSDLLSVDSVSKAIRVTNYDSNGVEHPFYPRPDVIETSPVTAVNTDVIASLDVSDYKWISLQIAGTFVGTIAFEGSNDNGTFYQTVVQNPAALLDPYITTLTGPGLIKIPILFKYLRVRVTEYVSGTVTGTALGYKVTNDSGQISSTGIVDGTLAVTNFPSSYAVTGTVGLGAGTEAIGSVKFLPANEASPIYLKVISDVGVNSTLVKSGASNLSILHIVNGAATQRFFKLYNQATAPTVGTDVPMITITLAPNSASNFTLPSLIGIDFSEGLAFAILLGVQDNSTTPFTVSGEVTAMLAYT